MSFKTLKEFIEYFESLPFFPHYQLSSKEYSIESENEEEKEYLYYEQIAFWFSYLKDSETIYNPMMTFQRPDWSEFWSPDRSLVNDKCIKYWFKRSEETKSIYMKFRYLTLLIDFMNSVLWYTKIKEEYWKDCYHNLTNNAINSGIEIIKWKLFKHVIYWINYIEIMLKISKSYSPERLNEIWNLCISFEIDIAKDELPWLWWFSIRYLILDDEYSKENIITNEQEKFLIEEIYKRYERLNKGKDIYWCVSCLELLLAYYSKKNDNLKIKETLFLLEKLYWEIEQQKDISAMIKSSNYENLKKLYLQYNPKDKDKIDQIDVKINSFWLEILDWMQTIQSKITITDQELDEIINEYYDKDKKELREKVFALKMIPSKDETHETLKNLIKEFPFQYRIRRKIYDKRWICIWEINWIESEKDLDSQLIIQYQRNISISWLWLDEICKLIKNNNRKENPLNRGILKNKNQEEIINKLRNYYIDWNNFEFCCMWIPIIEFTLREMLKEAWWIIVKNIRNSYEYKNLNDILKDQNFIEAFSKNFKDFPYYLRVLFVEKHGFNFRNNFAHWIDLQLFFSDLAANRIFHVLFCLSLLSFKIN